VNNVQIVFAGDQLRTNLIRSKNQRNYVGFIQNSKKGMSPHISARVIPPSEFLTFPAPIFW